MKRLLFLLLLVPSLLLEELFETAAAMSVTPAKPAQ